MKVRLPRNLWVFLAYLGLSLIWYARVLPPDRFFVGYDLEAAGYADRVFMAEGFRRGELRFWNPEVLGGMPTFAGMMLEFFSLSRPLWLVMDVDQVYKWDFITHTALASFFLFLLLSALGIRTSLAFAGGIAGGFGWIPSMAFAGHITKVYVYTWFPLLLFLLLRGVRSLQFRYFLYAGGIMTLMLWAQHLQMAYYAFLASGIWVLGWGWACYGHQKQGKQFLRALLFFAVSVIFGVWIGASQWLPGLLYVRNWSIRSATQRSLEFATSWSASFQDWISVWIPLFSGISLKQDTYWGENPFRHDLAYGSVLALVGILLGLLLWRRKKSPIPRAPLVIFAVEILVFSVITLADRTPVFSVLYLVLPFFRVLRAHSMALVYVAFFATVAGAFLIHHSLENLRSIPRRNLWIITGILGLGGLWILTAPQGWASFLAAVFHVSSERSPVLMQAVPLIGKALLWMAAVLGGLLSVPSLWPTLLPFLIAGELFVLTRPFVQPAPAMRLRLQEDAVIRAVRTLLENRDHPSRVLPLGYRTGESNWEVWGIPTAGGMFPFMPRTYAEWIGTSGFVLHILSFKNFFTRPEMVDVSGISVVVAPSLPDSTTLENRFRDHPQYPLLMALSRFLSRFDRVAQAQTSQGPITIFRNPYTRGLFTFYTSARRVPHDSTGLRTILRFPEDLRTVLLLSDPSAEELSSEPSPSPPPVVLEYGPGHAVVQIHAPQEGYLLFAENYHPQWHAWVDDRPSPVYRAFHTFMAVKVPEGTHRIILRYIPTLETRAWLLAGIGGILWSLLFLGTLWTGRRRDHG